MTYVDAKNQVATANSVEYAYRSTGEIADATPLVTLQHFRGNLDNWDPALIDALAARWGSRPVPGGKVVWAELSDPAGTELDSDLGSDLDSDLDFELGFDAEHEGEREADEPLTAFGQTALLRLPDVPVALLLARRPRRPPARREIDLRRRGWRCRGPCRRRFARARPPPPWSPTDRRGPATASPSRRSPGRGPSRCGAGASRRDRARRTARRG